MHGYVWLLDDGHLTDLELGGRGAPADPRIAQAMETAARIGALLADEARAGSELGDLLRELLASQPAGRAATAAALHEALRDSLRFTPGVPLTVVAVLPWDTSDTDVAPLPSLPGLLAACALPAGSPAPPAEGADEADTAPQHGNGHQRPLRGRRPSVVRPPCPPWPRWYGCARPVRSPRPMRWPSICCAPRVRAPHRPRAAPARRLARAAPPAAPAGRRRNRRRHHGADRPPGHLAGSAWTRPARPAPSPGWARSPSGTPSARTAC